MLSATGPSQNNQGSRNSLPLLLLPYPFLQGTTKKPSRILSEIEMDEKKAKGLCFCVIKSMTEVINAKRHNSTELRRLKICRKDQEEMIMRKLSRMKQSS